MNLSRCLSGSLAVVALASSGFAQTQISSPKQIIGFSIGDDYHMANYTQISTLWKRWEKESDRMKIVSIGNTAEGRPQLMAIISSPENLAKLDRYREISRQLSLATNLTEDQAHALAEEGKAVVWIDGGLHSSESVNSQQLAEMVYQMVSRTDKETLRFLRDVILLAPIANPDGVEVVANWYMREEDEKKRTFVGLPRLYNKYVGHDNNRDFLVSAMPETTNMNRVLYREWFPQIVYNHHQIGPAGAVVFIPPFRDPFNYNLDPLIPVGIDRVGMAMHERLIAKGMGGSAMRSAANYSTWWNGGLRTAAYFHNQIGMLTEVIGGPTPITLAFVPSRQLPTGDWPLPAAPQAWHYRQSVDYDVEINRAALDYASLNREQLLFNIFKMGHNSIERGSRDTWTVTPKRMQAVLVAAHAKDPSIDLNALSGISMDPYGGLSGVTTVPTDLYRTVLHDPANRDPRGYIISSDQADFPTAVKFINALLKSGVMVQKATAAFSVGGKRYRPGSYVVKCDQAFRPEVMDSFEPQDYPDDFFYPGGPPRPPYDITGWTLAVQMGVAFDRVLEGFDGPFEAVTSEQENPPAAAIVGSENPAGYLVSHQINDVFVLVNRLLKAHCEVDCLAEDQTVAGVNLGAGSFWIPATDISRATVAKAVHDLGFTTYGLPSRPAGAATPLRPIRIGLLDLYGGSMTSGWLRWILDQYEFPYEVIYPKIIDGGALKASFEVIVIPSDTYDGALARGVGAHFMDDFIKATGGTAVIGSGMVHYEPPSESIPEEYRSMLGNLTQNKTVPPLKRFLDDGGTIVALGSSTKIGAVLGVPLKDHLASSGPDGTEHHFPGSKFYVPGSVLRADFDNHDPLAYGMPAHGYVFFDNDPVFDLEASSPAHRVAWFEGKDALYSGWAWGGSLLDGGNVAAEATVGHGKVVLLGLEATFRATPHATFKLFFNGLFLGSFVKQP